VNPRAAEVARWLNASRLLPLGLLALLICGSAPAAAGEPLQECRIAGIRNSVHCGSVQRALDPARPDGATITVHFAVIPALARRRLPDPVFLLAGGPGQSAIGLAAAAQGLLQRLGNRRDLVFVDQRGTGRSAPLTCETSRHAALAEQLDAARQIERLTACRQRLQALPHGDLRQYTTLVAMQDLDAVRARLGAERINLVGASYGTRAALEYQRQFPSRVRRMVLDGVAPPDMVLPASSGIDAQAALDALFADCAAQAGCSAAHPRLREDWAALLAALPRSVDVAHPLTSEAQALTLTRDMLLAAVRAPLYSPALAAALPAALSQAAQGRFGGLLGLNAMFTARDATRIAEGMHFSVLCSEDMPRLDGAPALSRDFGDSALRQVKRVCADWPRADVPAAFYQVAPGAAPALLLSGGLDPATPPRHAERVAAALGPSARHVVVAHAGHGVLGIGCMRDVLFRFIDAEPDAQALAVDTACVSAIPRPPHFEPVSPAARSGATRTPQSGAQAPRRAG
jgi:pimeloyl-ACP methyl ester carboxylesterase